MALLLIDVTDAVDLVADEGTLITGILQQGQHALDTEGAQRVLGRKPVGVIHDQVGILIVAVHDIKVGAFFAEVHQDHAFIAVDVVQQFQGSLLLFIRSSYIDTGVPVLVHSNGLQLVAGLTDAGGAFRRNSTDDVDIGFHILEQVGYVVNVSAPVIAHEHLVVGPGAVPGRLVPGQVFLVDQAFRIAAGQPFQRVLHPGIGGAELHLAVFRKEGFGNAPVVDEGNHIAAVVTAVLAHSERNLVRLAVAVGITFLDGLEDVVQVFGSLRGFQAQLVQPVLTPEVKLAGGDGSPLADEAHDAIRVGDLPADFIVAVNLPQVRSVGFIDQVVQGRPGILVKQQVLRLVLHDGGEISAGDQQAEFFSQVFRRCRDDFNLDAQLFLQLIDSPQSIAEGHVLTVGAPDGNGHWFFRGCSCHKGQRQQADCKQQRQETGKVFHDSSSFCFWLTVYLNPFAGGWTERKLIPSRNRS